jgi:hypothetical protein
MRIENQKLLADITTVIGTSGYYLNEVTGEIRQGEAFSFLMSTLRDYKFRWKNVSDIREGDLEDSGFDILHADNYYNSPKSPWISIAPDYNTGAIAKGRRVAKSTWIICSKDVVNREELESCWMADTAARNAKLKIFNEIYTKAKSDALKNGMTNVEAMNHASIVANDAMKEIA